MSFKIPNDTAVNMSSEATSAPYNSNSEADNTAADQTTATETAARMTAMIERIIAEFPQRLATSDSERGAQELIKERLEDAGLFTRYESFRYNKSLYANIALHFGLATIGNVVGHWHPRANAVISGIASTSYWAESTRRGYLLRRFFPWHESQNLIGVSAAKDGKPKVRVVLIAHADAAYTGWLFNPEVMKRALDAPLPDNFQFLERVMQVATASQAAIAGIDFLRELSPREREDKTHVLLRTILSVPALVVALTNLEVVLRNEIVPGANDNLTGCAALPILAERLLLDQPDDVEYVFVVAGAEEASLGGSDALARTHLNKWNPEHTVVLAVDTLSNGDIRFIEREGEVQPLSIATRLRHCLQRAAATDDRFRTVRGFDMPVGGSDAQPFMRRGYHAAAISCVDPEIGAPRNYHHPSDTVENLDKERMVETVDFIEAAVREIVREYAKV